MLVARAQLDFIKTLVARFERHDNNMQPLIAIQSQYIAIITLLRSVGHVFANVDCDTEERKAWSKTQWGRWKSTPIFEDFIEPKRNDLLKEFRGGLELRNDAFSSPVILGDPSMPGSVSVATTLDAARLRDAEGRLVMPAIQQAVAFWDQCLSEAEAAFAHF